MKKLFIIFSIITFVLIVSVGIVDNLSALTDDLNTHLWLSLVGRWQSSESAYYEIEFYPDGTFSEYYFGVEKDFGDYHTDGNNIMLNYDISSCERDTGNSCTAKMKLYLDYRIIKIINNDKNLHFNKISGK